MPEGRLASAASRPEGNPEGKANPDSPELWLEVYHSLLFYLNGTLREGMTIPSLNLRESMNILTLKVGEGMNILTLKVGEGILTDMLIFRKTIGYLLKKAINVH